MEDRLLGSIKHYVTTAAQMAIAFNTAQQQLALETIFTPDEILSEEGRARSRGKISALAELMAAHKTSYATLLVEYHGQAADTLGGAVEDIRIERMAARVQMHIDVQHRFWTMREDWIHAVEALLEFVAGHEAHFLFMEGSLCIDDDGVLEAFTALTEKIDLLAQAESDLFRVRMNHLAVAAETLGIRIGH